MKKRGKIIWSVVLILLLAIFGGGAWYLLTYSHASEGALAVYNREDIEVENTKDYVRVSPKGESANVGYIFYPGAKVDEQAYLPYLADLAKEGFTCYALKVNFHLAILDQNAADTVIDNTDGMDSWVLGGHSLGGVIAARYAYNNPGKVSGLILLGSYPDKDLSGKALPVLSISASNDGLVDQSKFDAGKRLLPEDTDYATIHGGNHAGFGDYGDQNGDGKSTIGNEAQRARSVSLSGDFLRKREGISSLRSSLLSLENWMCVA